MQATLRQHGVELHICGQYLAAMPAASLTKDVVVAADAELGLIRLQNRGHALMSF